MLNYAQLWLEPWVRELEVLVEVVEAVEEVPELAAEERKDVAVAELADELDEEVAHLLVELGVLAAQELERLLGDAAQQLLGVDLHRLGAKGSWENGDAKMGSVRYEFALNTKERRETKRLLY